MNHSLGYRSWSIATAITHDGRLRAVDFIEKYLTDSGISQSELARRLGVSQPTVSDWISGKKKPGGDKVLALAKELGIPAERVLRHLYGG